MKVDGAGLKTGFMAVGSFVLLILLTYYTPLGFLTLLLLPLPFLFLFLKQTRYQAVLAVCAGILVVSVFFGLFGLLTGLFAAAVSGVLSYGFRRGAGAFQSFKAATAAVVVFGLVLLLISRWLLQIDWIALFSQSVQEAMQMSTEMMSQLGLPTLEEEDLRQSTQQILRQLPFFLIFGAGIYTFCVQSAAKWIFRLWDIEVPSFPPLRSWRLPKMIVYLYLAVLLLLFFPEVLGWRMVGLTLVNLQPLLGFLLVLQGLSFLFYYAHVKKKGKVIPVLSIISLLLFPQIVYIFVSVIGVVDTLFPLRQNVSK